jgi:hypothetical protein
MAAIVATLEMKPGANPAIIRPKRAKQPDCDMAEGGDRHNKNGNDPDCVGV